MTNAVLDVTQAPYNADAACQADDQSALQHAFHDAEAGSGNTVYFPAGQYCIKAGSSMAALPVDGAFPITVDGAGRDAVTISEQVAGQDLVSVFTDGTVVQNITLDAQTCGCGQGHAFSARANNTILRHARVLGGTTQARFPIYFAGETQRRGYAVGNQVIDVVLDDQICDDSFSFSYQHGGLIKDVRETGSRLALFKDQNVLVSGYTFVPGVQATTCPSKANGFYVTSPSSGITIDNFRSFGSGGVIGDSTAGGTNTGIRITNEQLLTDGSGLEIRNVVGLVIDNGTWGANGSIRFRPTHAIDDVTVQNVSSLPAVLFVLTGAGGQSVGMKSGVHFLNDVFPAFQPLPGQNPYTFSNPYGGPVTFNVDGGTWSRPAGGGIFPDKDRGPTTQCAILNLLGYKGPSAACR